MNTAYHLHAISPACRRPASRRAAWAFVLGLGLFISVNTSRAQATFVWTNTAASGTWQDSLAWTTNGGSTGAVPGPADNANFTNRNSTYTISLTADASVKEFLMLNPANTFQTITLDLGTNSLTLLETGTTAPSLAMELGDGGSSTSTLYITGSNIAGKGLYATNSSNAGRILMGRSGIAFLYVTNGFINTIETRSGNGGSGKGTITVSGSGTYWTNSKVFFIGNNVGSAKNALIISNSASLTTVGSFSVGGAASGTNSFLLDSGARLFTRAAGNNIGNGAGAFNTATIQGGASWDLGGRELAIGGTGISNSLTIGPNATVVNCNVLTNSPNNQLILTGGLLQVSTIVSNLGVITGFGTIVGNALNVSGGLVTPGFGTSVGTLILSNNLTLASGSTTKIKLDKGQTGSNDFLSSFGTITYGGTLTVTNVGAALVGGDSFKVFSFSNQSGDFGTTNLPPLDVGLIWYTAQLDSQGILTVVLPPGITGPNNQATNVGATVVISTVVTGIPTPTLQWQKDGTNLIGQTSDTVTISNAQTNDSGVYCLIANNIGGVVTNCMTLTVSVGDSAPTITGPTDQTVIQGNNGTFNASVAGQPAPTVQWQVNGVDIPGATGTPLILTNVQFSQDGFVYSINASNTAGSVTNSATLHVIVPPVIAVQPQSLVVTTSQSASFSVTSTNGVPPPTYQWYFNNGLISNATNSTYMIASAAAANMGTYHVVIANAAGSVTSTDATLTVNSTMAAATLTPANGATAVCYDTPLYITFDQTPLFRNAGKISIYNVTNPATAVDTLDMSLNNGSGAQSRAIAGDSNGPFSAYPIIITGNTAAIYPHLDVLSPNQTYFVTVDSGVFTDTNGALFVGITSTNAWQFTTKSTPANPNNLVVAADGSRDFCTVQGALDSLPNNNTTYTLVNIRNGTYTEIVDTRFKGHVTFRGQDRRQTIIAYANNNNLNGSTHTRMVFKVFSDDIAIENLTITNSTPRGGSQAEALMLDTNSKRFVLNNAELHSFLDTIDTGTSGSQGYFNNCLVRGDQDIIWGPGNLFITNCEVKTLQTSAGSDTQARTDFGSNGMSFVNCRITRDNPGVTNSFLGRALGIPNGNVVYVSCRIDDHIIGWSPGDSAISRYWEYGNSNLAATAAVSYNPTETLTNGDSRLACAQSAPCWLNGWTPQLAPNILTNPVSLTVTAGVNASFSVVATGIPDPTYQWMKDGSNLVSGTSATLTISNALAGDAGVYSVILSNAAGSVTSSNATLTVVGTGPSASFTASPTNGVELLTVTFTDTSTGSPNITLFWDFGDSTTATNAGGASFLHAYAAGTYSVTLTASNAFGANSTLVSNNLITVITAFQKWQLDHFGCTNCANAAAAADPDGDGQKNQAEFLAGTDPNSAGSSLHIISVAPQGVDMSITWVAGGGRTNVVQTTTGDYNTDFVDLSGPIVLSGSGDVTNNYLDGGGATNNPSRFYRIRLAP